MGNEEKSKNVSDVEFLAAAVAVVFVVVDDDDDVVVVVVAFSSSFVDVVVVVAVAAAAPAPRQHSLLYPPPASFTQGQLPPDHARREGLHDRPPLEPGGGVLRVGPRLRLRDHDPRRGPRPLCRPHLGVLLPPAQPHHLEGVLRVEDVRQQGGGGEVRRREEARVLRAGEEKQDLVPVQKKVSKTTATNKTRKGG